MNMHLRNASRYQSVLECIISSKYFPYSSILHSGSYTHILLYFIINSFRVSISLLFVYYTYIIKYMHLLTYVSMSAPVCNIKVGCYTDKWWLVINVCCLGAVIYFLSMLAIIDIFVARQLLSWNLLKCFFFFIFVLQSWNIYQGTTYILLSVFVK